MRFPFQCYSGFAYIGRVLFVVFFECFLLSILMRFFMILASKRGSEIITNAIFSNFWGVRFRVHILDVILDDFGMLKP